jgi:hypothetical protein
MKRVIEYESKMVMPDEIFRMFRKAEKDILEANEPGKIAMHLGLLTYNCIKWFGDHETIIEDEE